MHSQVREHVNNKTSLSKGDLFYYVFISEICSTFQGFNCCMVHLCSYSENLSPRQPGGDFADLDLSLPSIDLSLTLAEYWPGCSTLLIDVCPWCLLTNHSILDLVLIDSSKTTWPLPHGKTFSPPKLQVNTQISF